MTLTFVPPDGYRNVTDFPTKPASETAFRDSMQNLLDQIRDYVNTNVGPTSANITYFVATTGNDSNDGLSSGAALKTIQAAINKLPQTVNHTITINVAAGTYAEDVSISGITGKGSISLIGAADLANAGSYVLKSLMVEKNTLQIYAQGFEANNANSAGGSFVIARNPGFTEVTSCKSVFNDTSKFGAAVVGSICNITNCTFSLKAAGILANFMATVCSNNNNGASNTIGLQAASASKIGKIGTQPSATTNESTSGGSTIS